MAPVCINSTGTRDRVGKIAPAPRTNPIDTAGDYVPATPATFLDLDAFDAEADAQAIADIVGVARDRDD